MPHGYLPGITAEPVPQLTTKVIIETRDEERKYPQQIMGKMIQLQRHTFSAARRTCFRWLYWMLN